MNTQHIGSDFDDFLAEEGLLAEAEAIAIKRVIAFQIQKVMEEQNLSKSEMARRMNTSRSALNRLLDPENTSITLLTLARAALGVNKRVHFQFV